MMEKLKHFLLWIALLSGTLLQAQITTSTRIQIYDALASQDMDMLNVAIDKIATNKDVDSRAFKGTLLMKKAGLLKVPKEKLKVFKEGKNLLESSIINNSKNAEYSFLRLMIQENAPPILKYKSNIDEDAKTVRKSYHLMPHECKKALKAYADQSKILTSTDF